MTPCPHPDGESEPRFRARDYLTGDPFTVARCGRCGIHVTSPQPSSLDRYYPPSYYGSGDDHRFPRIVEALQAWLYRRRAEAVELLAGGPGRVLDIGCGPGRLLEAFAQRGWRTSGTELSEGSAAIARRKGIEVHVGSPEDGPWVEGSFDAVVMWHVLEHWPDPGIALAQAARLLRPGGVLMVGVPNFASPEARLSRDRWFHLDVPRHLVHLGDGDLARLLGDTGFEIRQRSYLAPEYDLFSFVQSVENRVGLRANLLYERLRGEGRGILESVVAFVVAAPLLALAVPETLVAASARRGATVTIWAVKPR